MNFLDRDRSILAFNTRVMDWACRADVPLLERLRYLGIVSSNLDEFFEVRMAPQLSAHKTNEQRGLYTALGYTAISAEVHALVKQQYAIYNDELLPLLEKKGIRFRRWPTSRSISSFGSPAKTRLAAKTKLPSSRCRVFFHVFFVCRPSRAPSRRTLSPSPA